MKMTFSLGINLLACLVGFVSGGTFVVTAPKNPYYDSQFTLTVSAHNISRPEIVFLKFTGFPRNSKLHSTHLTFEKDEVQTWGVVFNSLEMARKKETKVWLRMYNNDQEVNSKIFEFSENQGYIFIQTDKPLYLPGQKVKFRIIALDEYQRFASYHVKVEIKNPQSIVVDRLRYYSKAAFKARELDLPRECTLGRWTITASFEGLGGLPSNVATRTFEVNEYVLPRFSTKVDVSPSVITADMDTVTVKVESKYISGKHVQGLVEIQCCISGPDLWIPLAIYSEELERGKAILTFNVTDSISKEDIDEQAKRLVVNVTVTEGGTLETDNVQDDSALIVKRFYKVSFGGSKLQFKPGFTYRLQAHVTDAAENVVIGSALVLNVTCADGRGMAINVHTASLKTDRNGNIVHEFQTHSLADHLTARFSSENEAMNISGNELRVSKLLTKDGQYLQISMKTPLTKRRDGTLDLQYTKSKTLRMITILIVSRGHSIYTDHVMQEVDGHSLVQISSLIYEASLPFMRIVAFYHYGDTFITDSIRLSTKEECTHELRIRSGHAFRRRPLKPKAKMDIKVRGAPNMDVGLVAVDKAVFTLSEDQGLTRQTLFERLLGHDQGTDYVVGMDQDSYIKSSGLIHIVFHTHMSDDSVNFSKLTEARKSHFTSKDDDDTIADKSVPLRLRDEVKEPEVVPIPPKEKPELIRRYFPESWLFEEHLLSSNGKLTLRRTLPDSITSWSFMAIGVNPYGGMCISKPIEQKVQKLFFVDIRFPYKVIRLEEIKIKVVLFNDHTNKVKATVAIRGSDNLCFFSNKKTAQGDNSTHFSVDMDPGSTASRVIKAIPMRSGTPTITVNAKTNNDHDIVERKLYVVAEGQKMRKTLTFVLDPKAKHATFGKSRRRMTTLVQTKTLKSVIKNGKKQLTRINLAMPKEYIIGTESCKISAFGDIMGDIIDSAINKSKSLMYSSLKDAEEVIGDLGPTVHALLYANKSGLITEELRKKGQKFIRHSLLRLLRYRKDSAFRLTANSQEKATWLTTVALKTLCHAAPLAFIDKESLIAQGFDWLLKQVAENGSLIEKDWRLAKDSQDYKIMLSAEALIATLECKGLSNEGVLNLQKLMFSYLEENWQGINDVMVLAKVAYALTLFEPEDNTTIKAVERLCSMMRKNNKGHNYWSFERETNEKRKVPFWYYKGAKASSIEATAYALMVYLRRGIVNVDAIADWLVTQRNHQGVFVGALDSMAAIQALSIYSEEKHGIKVDMSCQMSANKTKDFKHSFKFTEENAIHPKSLSNVPVGDVIDIITKGQGLGQMHVNVEYNVPIDENARCRYNLSIQVKYIDIKFDTALTNYPLCMYCDVNCPSPPVEEKEITILNGTQTNNTEDDLSNDTAINDMPFPLPPLNHVQANNLSKSDKILSMEKKHNPPPGEKAPRKKSSYSRESLCLQVCVEKLDDLPMESIVIEIGMLSGYEHIPSDIEKLKERADIISSDYDSERDSVFAHYAKLADGNNCFTFRVTKLEDVRKPNPALVSIREIGDRDPSCVVEYSPLTGTNLHLFCANPENLNRGECRCFSGLCSACKPSSGKDLGLFETKELVRNADVGFLVYIHYSKNYGAWTDYKSQVLSQNITSCFRTPKKYIFLSTLTACPCPYLFAKKKEPLFMLTKDVEKMVDHRGKNVYRYLLDDTSTFLRVDPNGGGKTKDFLHLALNTQSRQCPK